MTEHSQHVVAAASSMLHLAPPDSTWEACIAKSRFLLNITENKIVAAVGSMLHLAPPGSTWEACIAKSRF